MQVWLLFLVLIIFTTIFSLIFNKSRPLHRDLTPSERNIAISITGFGAIIFSLLLGFTVSNFLNRFIDIRNTMIKEVTNLELIYRIFQYIPDALEVRNAMRTYVNSVIQEEWPLLQERKQSPNTEILYEEMNKVIINYIQTHTDIGVNVNILDRLSTDERRKRLVSALNDNNTLIIFIIIAALITLLGFWLLSTENGQMSFLFDFSVITVVGIGIFFLFVFDRPFSIQGMGLTDAIYEDLYNSMKETK